MASSDRVGVIGLGIMGSAMAANLMRGGFKALGYDLRAQRRKELLRGGGQVARNARDLAKRVPVVTTSLPSSDSLLQVATEIASGRSAGQIVIETSTLPIAIKDRARKILGAEKVTLIDCPLSGTGAQAKVKDIAVYASGPRSAYRRCIPVFEAFARTHYFLGASAAGSKMKFLANLLVAIHNVSAAEALVLGMKAGLDPALMVKVLGDGAGLSRMLQGRGPMTARNVSDDAAMKVGVWQKDMGIITEFARELDCPTPLFAATTAIYNAAMALGFAEADTGCVCAVLESGATMSRHS